jgi:SpoVK/Ycf46/Vps4 family AAA+-type ATPase
MCSRMRLSGSFDYSAIAKKTPGYVGADLSSLTKEAAVVAINRIFRCTHATTAIHSLYHIVCVRKLYSTAATVCYI